MNQQILHLDLVSLNTPAGGDERKQLLAAAGALGEVPGVQAAGAIEAEPGCAFDLAFYFLLADFRALEPFGTDQRYARFLQGSVAPVLQRLGGADIRLQSGFERSGGYGACLALSAPDDAYDWEVRRALEAWTQATRAQAAVVGLAAGERGGYRGAAMAFSESPLPDRLPAGGRFAFSQIRGQARVLV